MSYVIVCNCKHASEGTGAPHYFVEPGSPWVFGDEIEFAKTFRSEASAQRALDQLPPADRAPGARVEARS